MIGMMTAAALLLAPAYLAPAAKATVHNLHTMSAIRALTDRLAEAWQRGDAEVWGKGFTEDARFINVRGDVVVGPEAIEKIHAFIFQGPYKNSHLEIAIDDVMYPADDVAVVDTTSSVTGFGALPPGLVPTEAGVLRTRLKLILKVQDGEWKIVSAQNTSISPVRMNVK